MADLKALAEALRLQAARGKDDETSIEIDRSDGFPGAGFERSGELVQRNALENLRQRDTCQRAHVRHRGVGRPSLREFLHG